MSTEKMKERDWIDINEKKPEYAQLVFVNIENEKALEIAMYYTDSWYSLSRDKSLHNITHWKAIKWPSKPQDTKDET